MRMTNLAALERAQPAAVQFIPAPLFTGNTFTDDFGKERVLNEAVVVMVAADGATATVPLEFRFGAWWPIDGH